MNDHYITKNIKAYYKRRLVAPFTYLAALAVAWLILPLSGMLRPMTLSENDTFQNAYETESRYIRASLSDLKFTGYTSERMGRTAGYYYYTMRGGQCVIVLLSPRTCEEGLPTIDSITVTGRLVCGQDNFSVLLSNMADDLDWTASGIASEVSQYYLSEPDMHLAATVLFFIAYFGTIVYAVIYVLLCLVYIRFPVLSPPCQNLVVYGRPRQLLAEAEEELATLPQLATEDMFITEHYFIMTSPNGNAFLPISEILWIYKHSTLHKFLWYHFSISYTMHITASRHIYVNCPKNTKSDIDGIMDYLAEANHSILVGFNEENRLRVQQRQGRPLHIDKFYSLMRRRV
ncbi:MAG: hypothetical protein LUI02_04025 [Clostridiales bacterium]|nr:hypothetical protein [Clostridiales bacterium]